MLVVNLRFPEDVWKIPVVKQNSKQGLGYPTQKPLALYERIIKASTTPIMCLIHSQGAAPEAARKNNRRVIGIDILPSL